VPTTLRSVAPAAGLFLLAPLAAEYLPGDVSLAAPAYLVVLAPLYGGGALVVREVARRAGIGWPGILLLALAYAVTQEGLVTQTLFDRTYLGHDLLGPAYVPLLGMGAWWTLFVLTLDAVWSISVPIALVETLVPGRRTAPWLGPPGLAVAATLFGFGVVSSALGTYGATRFLASPAQLAGAAAVVAGAVAAAPALGRRVRTADPRRAPGPWPVAVLAVGAAGVFLALAHRPGWRTAGVYVALYVLTAALVAAWSRRAGWGAAHVLALAGGALLAYAVHGFAQRPMLGPAGPVDLAGNAVLAAGALALVAAGARAVGRERAGGCPGPNPGRADAPSRTPRAAGPP
jgi:hypothetical protein